MPVAKSFHTGFKAIEDLFLDPASKESTQSLEWLLSQVTQHLIWRLQLSECKPTLPLVPSQFVGFQTCNHKYLILSILFIIFISNVSKPLVAIEIYVGTESEKRVW